MNETLVTDAIGVAAGLCSVFSFVPQIVKMWREKHAEGVSLRTFALTATAFMLWIVFGLLQRSWPLAASNALALLLVAAIIALRIKYGRSRTKSFGLEREAEP